MLLKNRSCYRSPQCLRTKWQIDLFGSWGFWSSMMLRFAAGLGNSDFRGHVFPIFEGDLTTLEDEGAASWYVNPHYTA